jgi:NTE family protein
MLSPGRHRAAAVCLWALVLAGCSGGTAVLNKPLPPDLLSDSAGGGPISRGGYRPLAMTKKVAPDVLVLVAFSGGGKRSAAFGYGVLKGLRDYPVTVGGGSGPLLDQVDMMASVSGGSFPAAYYALYRDKTFGGFEKDFLERDINAYIYGTYLLPWKIGRVWVDPDYGTNDRMAEVYDDLMFHGATFADLQRAGRPFVSIDATDIAHGNVFAFIQDQFDLICSDLSSYPVARAVAASNGFPVLFTPITLKSYRPQCAGREPGWIQSDASTDPLDRVHLEAQTARQYLDADATRWVHLFDGGISDNLAMRAMISIMLVITGQENAGSKFDLTHVRRILFISADGQAANDASSAKQKRLSGLGQILNAVSGTQIDAYNFETLALARETLGKVREAVIRQRCAQGSVSPDGHACGDVESFFAHLSLAGVADPVEREHLQGIPTGLTVDKLDVDRLVVAGQTQVMESREIQAFRDSLR